MRESVGPGSPPREGPSQLGVDASMRARDVSRPTADDLDAAEREVEIKRQPPSSRSSARGGNSPVRS